MLESALRDARRDLAEAVDDRDRSPRAKEEPSSAPFLDGIDGIDTKAEIEEDEEAGRLRLLQIAARIPQHRARSSKEILKTYLRNR